MIRTVAMIGVIVGSGWIGWMGVSAIQERCNVLCGLQKDMRRLSGLLTEHGMSLVQALERLGGGFAEEYRFLSQWLKNASTEDLSSEGVTEVLESRTVYAEMKKRETELFALFLCRLAECISPSEVSPIVTWFIEETERVIGELKEGELKRAKVLRMVWSLGGLCAAIILI